MKEKTQTKFFWSRLSFQQIELKCLWGFYPYNARHKYFSHAQKVWIQITHVTVGDV